MKRECHDPAPIIDENQAKLIQAKGEYSVAELARNRVLTKHRLPVDCMVTIWVTPTTLVLSAERNLDANPGSESIESTKIKQN